VRCPISHLMKKKKIGSQLVSMTILLLTVFSIAFFLTMRAPKDNTQQQQVYAATQKSRINRSIPTPTKAPTPSPTVIKIPTPTAVPVTTTVKFGAVIEEYENTSNITSLEQKLGTNINTVSIFKQFGIDYNKTFDDGQLGYLKSSGKTIQFAWEPWNPEQGMSQSEDYLKGITSGTYDGYIRQTAQSVKAYGGPVNLRFGHEMNGDWYPWGKRPADYVAAYRYIHTLFQQEGVTNVRWMWCVNITETPQELTAYYPGNDVVDVVGIDGFNFGTTQNYGGWRSFANLFGPTYTYVAKTYPKPIIIAETASAEQGGDKAAWVKAMFTSLPTQFPKVSEIIWFNLLKEADWRVDSSASSLNAFISYL
jgi:beta-mannanase